MPISLNKKGICPHCNKENKFQPVTKMDGYEMETLHLYIEEDVWTKMDVIGCNLCGKIIIIIDNSIVYPINISRKIAPEEVPPDIAKDYNEACLIENLSKNASAALARRCLQNMLHEQGINKKSLFDEINEAIEKIPDEFGDCLHLVREFGNFGAHPNKSEITGMIIDVEEGETECILDILQDLFACFYVIPASKKKARLKAKKTMQIHKKETKSRSKK